MTLTATRHRPDLTLVGSAALERVSTPAPTPGSRLRDRREELGLTTVDAAKRMGWARPSYSQYEAGSTHLSIEKAAIAAAALNMSPEYLCFGIGQRLVTPVYVFTGGEYKPTAHLGIPSDFARQRYMVPDDELIAFQSTKGSITLLQRYSPHDRHLAASRYVYAYKDEVHEGKVQPLHDGEKLEISASNALVDAADVNILGRIVGRLS